MAPRMPKKLAKKSLTRDSSGGGDNNDNIPSLTKSPSMASRKFSMIKPMSSSDGNKKSQLSPDIHKAGNSPSGHNAARGGGGGKTMSRSTGSQQPFETSEGAMRLNRILDNSSAGMMSKSAPVGGSHGLHSPPLPSQEKRNSSSDTMKGGRKGMSPSQSSSSAGAGLMATSTPGGSNTAMSAAASKKLLDYIPPSTIQLADPTDERAVGEMTCRISSKMRVDVRSIGGKMLSGEGKVEARTGNVLLREGWEDLLENKNGISGNAVDGENGDDKNGMKYKNATTTPRTIPTWPMNRLTNECLYSMCVSQFDLSLGLSGGPSGGKKRHIPIAKSRNKLRYIVIVRSTNRALLRPKALGADGSGLSGGGGLLGDDDDSLDNGDDLGSDDGFDHMYNPDPGSEAGEASVASSDKKKKKKKRGESDKADDASTRVEKKKSKKLYAEYDCGIPPEREISSFPVLFCLAIHADGTKPDVRKVLELDKLVSIENSPPRKNAPPGSAGHVVLIFRNGDAVEIDCDLPNAVMHSDAGTGGGATSASAAGGKKNTAMDTTNRLRKERFLWSLLQIHAILCTAVVERTAADMAGALARRQLPPLAVRNVDRGELQYVSTVNGFLTDSPVLCSLLDRQSSHRGRGGGGGAVPGGDSLLDKKTDAPSTALTEEGKSPSDEMDGMAYDMMMGNYNRVALFVDEEEKQDAADVLNATAWQQQEITSDGMANVDASATAETLIMLLQQRMRDLEAETCQRLISWEDEKYYSASGERPMVGNIAEKVSVNAMSVNDLFQTLQSLDSELERMELWIQDRATMIKPITDECRGIEEENRMLEQQWVSYETLGTELTRLLNGLVLPKSLLKVLENPGSVIKYDRSGAVDINRSEEGVELIHQAGQALKLAIDAAEGQGGIHLRAISETVKGLSTTSNKFCGSLARIVVTVMEQLAKEVSSKSAATIGKGDTHTSIAKKIRETQRQFQASLLAYIKIIEVLALLKPDILPAVRDAYSELVAEGIMSKKRMKFYFASLPGRTSVKIASDVNFDALALPGRTSASVTHDLSEYAPVALRHPNASDASGIMKPVNVEDIEAALSEMLPLIAREAYFTAALFGLSSRHLDGRQKKRNFEAAKKSVDNSSQYFRYYMNRICGIASDMDAEGKKVKGDAMLSLVASIHLNEAMVGYIDRNKKGGDHSLSLAYVRATILDLRKKVDKQWVNWIEDQIKWIRTNPGVPPTGKRAGIFASIARLPSYLDHVLICCKAGRPKDYTPNLAKIKVVSYYLQKMASSLFASLNECAERETTDQQYAANVMRMENSYFFTQSIKQRGIELTTLFQKQITGASVICKQSTDAYLGWMIKREFKAMHSLFSNISRIRKDVGDADVPIHVPRAQFVRTLQKESSKEIMKEKIGVVYARMEKHLSESGGLLPVAWKALVKVLYEWFGRWEKLSTSCYKFILEPSAIDVVRIAKSASGSAASSGKRNTDGRPSEKKYVSI
ncbi:hypothetical protein ACHAXR_011217 [Thalassiosira sp. AJA248-18]